MKKILALIFGTALMCCAIDASAQFSVGSGYLYSNLRVTGDGTYNFNMNGVYIGGTYDWAPFSVQGLTIEPGLYYAYQRLNNTGNDGDIDLHYIQIPVHAKYSYDFSNEFGMFASAGPGLSVGVAGSQDVFDSDKGNMRRFDIQAGAEVGVVISNLFQVKAGYDFGLLDLSKPDVTKTHRNQFHAGVAVLF